MAAAVGTNSSLLYVVDKKTKMKFLVDTGAELSVLHPNAFDKKLGSQGPSLVAANGTPIVRYGRRKLNITLENKSYAWVFIIAKVSKPLLGADFLRSHNLLVDLKNKCLIDSKYFASIPMKESHVKTLGLTNLYKEGNEFSKILEQYPRITDPKFSATSVSHNVYHHIITNGAPVYGRARRLPPDKFLAAKNEFQTMETLGIIRRSKSSWSSPLHVVPKSDRAATTDGSIT